MMHCSAVLQLSMALRGAVLAASISLLLFSAASGCRRPAAPPAVGSDSAEAAPHREGVAPAEPRKSALPAADPPVADAGALEIIKWPPKFGERQLRASIEQAIDYLVRTTDEHGKFAYIVNTHPEVPATDEYNVVRHAGTMYGLGMYLERYEQDADAVRAALLRQGAFLRKQIKPVEGRQDMLAIWSEPDITGREGPRRAELGSAALGLIGLSCVAREAPGSVPDEELRALANFILFMQREDGSFYKRYVPEAGGRQHMRRLLFYPGESALALVLLYEVDGNRRWLEAAARAIAFMSRQRDDRGRPVRDHWYLLATARMWPHYDKTSEPVSREQLIRYAMDLCERLMKPAPGRASDPRLKDCIAGNGLTCPTATRVEGLVAALQFLPKDKVAFRARVQNVAEDAIVFLMHSQVSEGDYRGGIPYANLRLPKDHPWRQRNYDRKAGEIRIDYVHHAIAGMMLYDDVVLGG